MTADRRGVAPSPAEVVTACLARMYPFERFEEDEQRNDSIERLDARTKQQRGPTPCLCPPVALEAAPHIDANQLAAAAG